MALILYQSEGWLLLSSALDTGLGKTVPTFPDTRIEQCSAELFGEEARGGSGWFMLAWDIIFFLSSLTPHLSCWWLYCLVQAAEQSEPEGTETSFSLPFLGFKDWLSPHNTSSSLNLFLRSANRLWPATPCVPALCCSEGWTSKTMSGDKPTPRLSSLLLGWAVHPRYMILAFGRQKGRDWCRTGVAGARSTTDMTALLGLRNSYYHFVVCTLRIMMLSILLITEWNLNYEVELLNYMSTCIYFLSLYSKIACMCVYIYIFIYLTEIMAQRGIYLTEIMA